MASMHKRPPFQPYHKHALLTPAPTPSLELLPVWNAIPLLCQGWEDPHASRPGSVARLPDSFARPLLPKCPPTPQPLPVGLKAQQALKLELSVTF